MGIDINTISQIGRAIAVGERNENNRKHPGSRDAHHETWEETNRKAAQNTVAIIALIAAVTILFKLLAFFGRLSIKLFGPKLGRVVNALGLVLLIVIPACTLKMSADRHAAEAAAAAEAAEAAEAKYRKQQNDEISAYRDTVRARMNGLSERCADDPMAFTNILEQFERKSKVVSNSNMSKDFAYREIDRAYESCVEILNARDEKRIHEYFLHKADEVKGVANEAMTKLRELGMRTEVAHIEHARDEFTAGRRYQAEFSKAKDEIDADGAQCVAKIARIVTEYEKRAKIDAYKETRIKELEALSKKDRFRKGDYCVETFKRKMVQKAFGGCIDYGVSYEEMKKCIDEEYHSAEKQIMAILK